LFNTANIAIKFREKAGKLNEYCLNSVFGKNSNIVMSKSNFAGYFPVKA
jgi:hypothetical protein